jgi:putative tricarboxylic transport membrane protein
MKGIDGGQMAVALGVAAIGLFFFAGSFYIPDAAGYSTVGPALIPRVVGGVLIFLGGFLAYEVVRGGFRNHDEAAERALHMDWAAFAWVSGGLIAYGLLIERAGFIVSSVVLFVCVARSFGSRRWTVNTIVALVLAIAIFAAFNYGLGLNLPKGVLEGVL